MIPKFRLPIIIIFAVSLDRIFFDAAAAQPSHGGVTRDQALQTDWNVWKSSVFSQISARFNKMIKECPHSFSTSEDQTCTIDFVVSKAKEIVCVRSSQKSSDPYFDALASMAVKSFSEAGELQFPINTDAQYVECLASFSRKNGLTSSSTKFIEKPPKASSNTLNTIPPSFRPPSLPVGGIRK